MDQKKRLNNLLEKMKEKNISFFIIGPSDNLRSLLGFSPGSCERFQALIIKNTGELLYISPQIYYEEINEILPANKIYMWKDREGHKSLIKEIIRSHNLADSKIAVDSSISATHLIDISKIANFNFCNGTELIEELRIIKNKEETGFKAPLNRMQTEYEEKKAVSDTEVWN